MLLVLMQKRRFCFLATHHIISLVAIGPNSFVSRLLQHVILLTYEHVSFNWASYEYVDIIQKIVNKRMDVNAKQKNGKMHMKTTVMHSFQYYSWYSIFIFIFVSLIIICVVFCNYVHIM